jgi:hypothetical protein
VVVAACSSGAYTFVWSARVRDCGAQDFVTALGDEASASGGTTGRSCLVETLTGVQPACQRDIDWRQALEH